jgi:hypothetical protein
VSENSDYLSGGVNQEKSHIFNSKLKWRKRGLQKVPALTGRQKIMNNFEILDEITELGTENNFLRSALEEMLNK